MKIRALVAPLDWGLGHATRVIPVVRELLETETEVILAGSGDSLELLRAEFPSLEVTTLPSYQPRYSRSGRMVQAMALQIPKFLRVIAKEHAETECLVAEREIGLIISDNRYGCWSEHAHSVIITHQSNILMPQRFGWLSGLVQKVTARQIAKFHRCWIPDFPDGRLSGLLSRHDHFPVASHVAFVGGLSRFRRLQAKNRFDIAAIFSGPEPQRTLFEELVVPQLAASGLRYFYVRGLPGQTGPGGPHHVNHLDARSMERLMAESDIIICRSGYSSILDLACMGRRAILVPTPGQTEQEYLAAQMKTRKLAYAAGQKGFDLMLALKESAVYSGLGVLWEDHSLLQVAVTEALNEASTYEKFH